MDDVFDTLRLTRAEARAPEWRGGYVHRKCIPFAILVQPTRGSYVVTAERRRVEIATGEVALFWNTVPAQTRRLARGLRADLAQLEADAFIAKWRRWQVA